MQLPRGKKSGAASAQRGHSTALRYATLNNYDTDFPGAHTTQKGALRQDVRRRILDARRQRLGANGKYRHGENHLTVGIIRELINLYGVRCYFADQQALF